MGASKGVGAIGMLDAVVILGAAVLLAFASGCGSDSGHPAGAASTTTIGEVASLSSTGTDEVHGLVDIGGGRQLYLNCAGTGSPTILLEAGDEDGSASWSAVKPKLAGLTRTCAYDRVGNGTSSDATGCRELDDILGDLEALLRVAKVDGPFVLVGHSGGGFLMAAFAARRPADVAGLVLVETPAAIATVPPELEAVLKCDAPTNIEHRDYVTIERTVWNARGLIGDFPMTIISNDFGAQAPASDGSATNVADQRGWLVLSPNSRQVVVTTGHEVQDNEPDLVVREVTAVLDAARARK